MKRSRPMGLFGKGLPGAANERSALRAANEWRALRAAMPRAALYRRGSCPYRAVLGGKRVARFIESVIFYPFCAKGRRALQLRRTCNALQADTKKRTIRSVRIVPVWWN